MKWEREKHWDVLSESECFVCKGGKKSQVSNLNDSSIESEWKKFKSKISWWRCSQYHNILRVYVIFISSTPEKTWNLEWFECEDVSTHFTKDFLTSGSNFVKSKCSKHNLTRLEFHVRFSPSLRWRLESGNLISASFQEALFHVAECLWRSEVDWSSHVLFECVCFPASR